MIENLATIDRKQLSFLDDISAFLGACGFDRSEGADILTSADAIARSLIHEGIVRQRPCWSTGFNNGHLTFLIPPTQVDEATICLYNSREPAFPQTHARVDYLHLLTNGERLHSGYYAIGPNQSGRIGKQVRHSGIHRVYTVLKQHPEQKDIINWLQEERKRTLSVR